MNRPELRTPWTKESVQAIRKAVDEAAVDDSIETMVPDGDRISGSKPGFGVRPMLGNRFIKAMKSMAERQSDDSLFYRKPRNKAPRSKYYRPGQGIRPEVFMENH